MLCLLLFGFATLKFLAIVPKGMFGAKTTLHITKRTPYRQWNMVVAAYCLSSTEIGALQPNSTEYVSTVLHLRHARGGDRFHFSLCVNPHQVRCTAHLLHPSPGSPEPSSTDVQDFYFWLIEVCLQTQAFVTRPVLLIDFLCCCCWLGMTDWNRFKHIGCVMQTSLPFADYMVLLAFSTSKRHWDSLKQSVKKLRWKPEPPIFIKECF